MSVIRALFICVKFGLCVCSLRVMVSDWWYFPAPSEVSKAMKITSETSTQASSWEIHDKINRISHHSGMGLSSVFGCRRAANRSPNLPAADRCPIFGYPQDIGQRRPPVDRFCAKQRKIFPNYRSPHHGRGGFWLDLIIIPEGLSENSSVTLKIFPILPKF